MESTHNPLMFQGIRLSETYRPIEHIIQQCEFFMNYPDAGHGFLGGFMTAILDNDFKEACGRADDINGKHLRLIATFIRSYGECVVEKHHIGK